MGENEKAEESKESAGETVTLLGLSAIGFVALPILMGAFFWGLRFMIHSMRMIHVPPF